MTRDQLIDAAVRRVCRASFKGHYTTGHGYTKGWHQPSCWADRCYLQDLMQQWPGLPSKGFFMTTFRKVWPRVVRTACAS